MVKVLFSLEARKIILQWITANSCQNTDITKIHVQKNRNICQTRVQETVYK